MDHGEDGGQVALPGPHKEQPVDTRAGSQACSRATQAGWPVERACAEAWAPSQGLLVTLTESAGKGENSGGALTSNSPTPHR